MIEFITEYALWLVGNASPGHKRVFFIPVLFCCLHPFLPHCIVFLGAPWAAFPAQTWAEPPSLAAGCRQAWSPPGAAFSGNWAISGPGCSQEMRRQPWRYIFLNWTFFFFFFPPYFVAGIEWFVGAWGGRASAWLRRGLGPVQDQWGCGRSEMWANDPEVGSQNSEHGLVERLGFLLVGLFVWFWWVYFCRRTE